jgi:hypothetical protein
VAPSVVIEDGVIPVTFGGFGSGGVVGAGGFGVTVGEPVEPRRGRPVTRPRSATWVRTPA